MRAGILGIAHMHVHSYLKELVAAGVPVTGVYDRDEKAAAAFCQANQLEQKSSVAELLATDCDTVVICSENVFHKELAIEAAQAKKHIIVEKPMALSVEDAQAMIDAAAENSVKLMVAHPVRFSKPAQDLKRILTEGDFGEVRAINSSNHGKNPGGWFIDPDLSGGGALIDHTVHISDLVNYLFAIQPAEVSAFISQSDPEMPVEDIGLVHLRFENDVIMSLDTSWNRPSTYPIWGDAILEVIFDSGYLIMDGFGRKMQIYNDVKNETKEIFFEEDMDHLMMTAFIEAIDENKAAPVSGADGLYTVLITEKAFEAANLGETITI